MVLGMRFYSLDFWVYFRVWILVIFAGFWRRERRDYTVYTVYTVYIVRFVFIDC